MTQKLHLKREHTDWFTYSLIVILWLVYTFLTFQSPQSNSNQFNLTQTQIALLRLTIVVPYLVIWLTATFGLLRFKRYVTSISGSDDGRALSKMGIGLDLLVFGLLFSAVLGVTRSFFMYTPHILRIVVIFINYSYVFIPLIAFWMLFTGSRDLLKLVKRDHISNTTKTMVGSILLIFACSYFWLIITNTSLSETYYLPRALVLLTIVLPSLVTWGLGIMSALYIQTYAKNVVGIIYKQALSKFVYGIYVVVTGSIFLQALLSLGAERLIGLSLGFILGIVYLFLILQGLGFFLIAMGSNKLSKLESVS